MDGLAVDVGRTQLVGIHVPGHTDGGMCWYAAELGALFTGDSLSAGGVGPASSGSDRARLLSAVRARLFTLPLTTTLHPGTAPTPGWARCAGAATSGREPRAGAVTPGALPAGRQRRRSTIRLALPSERSMAVRARATSTRAVSRRGP